MKTSDIGKTVWMDRFGKAYKKKWKDQKKSQYQFAKAINEVRDRGDDVSGTVTSQQVSKWLHGSIPEEKNLKAICEVLGLDEEYFSPTKSEKYRDSSQYITELGKEHAIFSEEIGLDLDFLKGVHNVVDFDSLFPMYAPIVVDNSDIMDQYIRLENHAESAPIDESLDFMQIHRDGQTRTLHRCDLAYLREVQDQVVEFVEYLFYKRREEMKKEVEEANRRTHGTATDGGEWFRPLNYKEMCEIDRFAKHAYKDAPDEGGQDDGKH